MGHKNYVRIDNNHSTFERKIEAAKQQVHRVLGRGGGTTFYKKFLLKKAIVVRKPSQILAQAAQPTCPINLPEMQHFEESVVTEIFINYSTTEGRVIEASIEKKGSNQAYAYTLKYVVEQ